jgi:hypothetical protein
MSFQLLPPDVVFDPSAGARLAAMSGSLENGKLPNSATAVRMVLKEVLIRRPGEIGRGEIQVITVVSDGVSDAPLQLETKVYERVKRNSKLPIGPGGLVVYLAEGAQMPRFLNYKILVLELDAKGRNAGEWLAQIHNDEKFKSTADGLLKAAITSTPTVELIAAASNVALSLIAHILRNNNDDQLLLIEGSYDSRFDDLGTKYGLVRQGNQFVEVAYEMQAA